MPYTFNGIGTWYHHDRNSVSADGRCAFCGFVGPLRSYDTTLAFCIVFFPILKIRDYRILESCPKCRRHRRVPLAEYVRSLDGALAADLTLAKAGDAAAARRIVATFLAQGRWQSARSAIEDLLKSEPTDATLHVQHAKTLEKLAPRHAWQAWERAFELDRSNTETLRSFASAAAQMNEHAKAVEGFTELARREPDQAPDALALARALRGAKRFAESAEAYERFFALDPARQKAYLIVDELIGVKQLAGLPLHDLELRRQASRRRTNRIALAVLSAGGLAVLAVAAIASRRARIIVDNPSPVPLQLRLDGERWLTVAPGRFADVSVWRGHHRVDSLAGDEKDSFDVDWDVPGLRGLAGTTFVCDPLQMGSYVIYEVAYGTEPRDGPQRHVCERTFNAGRIDHAFEAAPATIRLEHGRSEIRRVLDHDAHGTPLEVAEALVARGQTALAFRYLETRLQRSDDPTLLVALQRVSDEADEGAEFGRWLSAHLSWDEHAVSVHRFRQDLLRREGRKEELARLYRTAANNAVGVSLRGRAALSSREALECFEIASSMDEQLPWPWLDAGELLLAEGHYDEAIEKLRHYARARRRAAREPVELWRALFVARRWADLDAELATAPPSPTVDLIRSRRLIASDAPAVEWREHLAALRKQHGAASWIAELEIERARWLGDARTAEKLLPSLSATLGEPTSPELLRAGIRLEAGDAAGAEQQLERVLEADHVPTRAVHLALLSCLVDRWGGGEGSRGLAAAESRQLDASLRELVLYLRQRLAAGQLAEGDRIRELDERAVSRIARALDAADEAERSRLLDEALRFASWSMSDAASLIRAVFARSAPRR